MADTNQNQDQTPEEEQKNPILRAAGVRTASAPTTVVIPEAQTDTGAEKLPVAGTKTPVPVGTLPTMLDAIKVGIGVGTEYQREVIKSKTKEADLNSKLARTTTELGKDKAIIDQQKRQATLKAERSAVEAFEAGGGVDALIELKKGAAAAREEMIRTQEFIDEANVQWNPIQKFFGMGAVREDAAIAEAIYDKYNKAIQNATNNTNAIAATIDNMKLSETDATLAANARIFVKQAVADATAFEIKAAESNAVASDAAVRMTNRNVDQRLKMYDLIERDKNNQALVEERQMRRDQVAKLTEFDDTYAALVHKGLKDSGEPFANEDDPAAMAEEKSRILTARQAKGTAAYAAVNEAFDIGARTSRPTYFQTMKSIHNLQKESKLTDGKNRSLTFFKEKSDESLIQLQAARVADNVKGKVDEATVANTINSGVGAAWKKAEAEISSEDLNNPNHAPPLGELIKITPALQEHAFIKNELLPLMSDPDAPVDDLAVEKVLELGISNIKTKTHPERKYKFEEVDAAIGALYKRAAVYNTDSQGRDIYSFPLQTTYNAKLKGINAFKFSPLSFGGFELVTKDNIVDMTDGTQRRQLLLRMLSGTEKGLSDIGPDLFKGLIGIKNDPNALLPEGAK